MMKPGLPVLVATAFDTTGADNSLPGVGRLIDGEIEKIAGIRHARHYGRAACLLGATASSLRSRIGSDAGRLGVVCNGGPWNLAASWDFIARAREAGPAYVNPLRFPPTLVSACATAVA